MFEQIRFLFDYSIYYNIRSRIVSIERNEFINLVIILKETDFIFECQIEEKFNLNTDKVVDRQLQQVWFVHFKQIQYVQYFITNWTLFVNETFRTNKLNLVFIIIVDITNYNSIFINSLSFIRSENKLFFDFIFKSLKKHVFYSFIPVLHVVVNDQVTKIKISMSIFLSTTILQFYN